MSRPERAKEKARLALATALAAIAALLWGVRVLEAPSQETRLPAPSPGNDVQAEIGTILDTLLTRYGIEPSGVRTWRMQAAGKSATRVEQKAFVPPSFVALDFNHDLNLALAGVGAHVVATERSRENIVTMHIVRGGRTIRSISFETAQENDR
jgi:hypothetical protein